jgi:molybdopterin-guanine dinucleotide biosynthesis protein A
MGADKAMIEIGGKTLLQRALDNLTYVSDNVFVVGDRPEYRQYGVPVFADAYPGTGTLGGIATAIRYAEHERVLVVACDMPLLSRTLLQAMVAEPADYDVLVPVTAAERSGQGSKQTYETLHAIYRRTCLAPIERRLTDGQLKVIGFFDDVNVMPLATDWIARYDPSLRSFMNANTPEDIQTILALLGNDGQSEGCE